MMAAYFTHLSSSSLHCSVVNMSQSSAPLDGLSPRGFFYICSKQTHVELLWWMSPLQRKSMARGFNPCSCLHLKLQSLCKIYGKYSRAGNFLEQRPYRPPHTCLKAPLRSVEQRQESSHQLRICPLFLLILLLIL